MAQGYSRENGSKNRDRDRDRISEFGARGSGRQQSQNRNDESERGSGQYARDDERQDYNDMRRAFHDDRNQRGDQRAEQRGGRSGWAQQEEYAREQQNFGRENNWDSERRWGGGQSGEQYGGGRDDYAGSRMGGYGRSQQWGGGYNEGGYDQRGTWGGGRTQDYGSANYGSGDRDFGDRYRERSEWSGGQGYPQTRYGAGNDGYAGQGSRDVSRAYGGYDRKYGGNRDSDYQRNLTQQREQSGRFDEDYLSWRDEQMRKLDDDYQAYRQENRTKFNDEFEGWRNKRASSGTSGRERTGDKSTDKGRNKTTSGANATGGAKDVSKH